MPPLMACLLVAYDLDAPGQRYAAVHEAIKSLGTAWWHYLESTWIVETSLSPQDAWTRLAGSCDRNDRVLIVEIPQGSRRQGWLEADAWEWINNRL